MSTTQATVPMPSAADLPTDFPALKQRYSGPPNDGLCHAYHEYVGLDCLQTAGHDTGVHGSPDPKNRTQPALRGPEGTPC